jgi:hypothetical protein
MSISNQKAYFLAAFFIASLLGSAMLVPQASALKQPRNEHPYLEPHIKPQKDPDKDNDHKKCKKDSLAKYEKYEKFCDSDNDTFDL